MVDEPVAGPKAKQVWSSLEFPGLLGVVGHVCVVKVVIVFVEIAVVVPAVHAMVPVYPDVVLAPHAAVLHG